MAACASTSTGIVFRKPKRRGAVRKDTKKGAAAANARSICTSRALARDSPTVLATPAGTASTTWCFSTFACCVRDAAFSTAMQIAARTSQTVEETGEEEKKDASLPPVAAFPRTRGGLAKCHRAKPERASAVFSTARNSSARRGRQHLAKAGPSSKPASARAAKSSAVTDTAEEEEEEEEEEDDMDATKTGRKYAQLRSQSARKPCSWSRSRHGAITMG